MSKLTQLNDHYASFLQENVKIKKENQFLRSILMITLDKTAS